MSNTDRIRETLGHLWSRAYDREDIISMFLIQDAMSGMEFTTRLQSRDIWKRVYKLLFVEK